MLREVDRPQPRRPEDNWDEILAQVVGKSADLGLLGDLKHLELAGDSTPLVSGAHSFGKKVCECPKEARCKCLHRFSDPDALNGWDSYRNRHFFGRSLYVLSDTQGGHNLPVSLLLCSGNRHDSTAIPAALARTKRRYATVFKIRRLILDSAHDADAIYNLCNAWGIEPIIKAVGEVKLSTLHERAMAEGIRMEAPDIVKCRAGYQMAPRGRTRGYLFKWACPLKNKSSGLVCLEPCHYRDHLLCINNRSNPRLAIPTPYGSEAWQNTFDRRTAVERTFARTKTNFALDLARHRRTCLWYGHAALCAISMHVTAWMGDTPSLVWLANWLKAAA